MANQLYGNPVIIDATTNGSWTGTKYVKQAQWVDDAGDIAQDDVLIMVVNGVTITAKVAAIDANVSTTHWEFGPFDKGVPWKDLTVTIPHGALILWIE
jgi:hypothetical protein